MPMNAGPSTSTATLEDFKSYAKDCHDLEERRRQDLRDECRQLAAFIYVLVGLESAAAVQILTASSGLTRYARLGTIFLLFALVCGQILLSIRMLCRAYTGRVQTGPKMPNVLAEHLSSKDRDDILRRIGGYYNDAADQMRHDNELGAADVRSTARLVCATLAALFVALVVVVFYGLNPNSLL